MSFALTSVVFFLIGVLVYGAIVFWAGKRRLWWLAILLSLPALMGGILSMNVDMSSSSSPLFRNFGLLVIAQLVFGLVVYLLGRSKGQKLRDNLKDFE